MPLTISFINLILLSVLLAVFTLNLPNSFPIQALKDEIEGSFKNKQIYFVMGRMLLEVQHQQEHLDQSFDKAIQ